MLMPQFLRVLGTPLRRCRSGRARVRCHVYIARMDGQYGEAKFVRVTSAMANLFQWKITPRYRKVNAEGRWEAAWPGYTCSEESLDRYRIEGGEVVVTSKNGRFV